MSSRKTSKAPVQKELTAQCKKELSLLAERASKLHDYFSSYASSEERRKQELVVNAVKSDAVLIANYCKSLASGVQPEGEKKAIVFKWCSLYYASEEGAWPVTLQLKAMNHLVKHWENVLEAMKENKPLSVFKKRKQD